jgi:ADP-heptose:LPS heptosyltransferase
VKPLGVVNDNKPCDVFLTPKDAVDLTSLGLQEETYVGVAMGAQFATKQMPLDLMVDVLQGIEAPIVLLGGPMDESRAKQLMQSLPGKQLVDLTGKLSLRQSAFMTKYAKVLFSGDTGLMHIASAFETPIVSVWGNTVPALGMFTYAPNKPENFSVHEVMGLSCRPCSKIGYQSCPKKHFRCMQLQDKEAIQLDLKNRLEVINESV